MSDQLIAILSLSSIVLGLFAWRIFCSFLRWKTWWKRASLKAPVYALFFGIGIVGDGNGDTGFAFPLPIIPAFFASSGREQVVGAVYPFFIWVGVFLLLAAVKEGFRRRFPLQKARPD